MIIRTLKLKLTKKQEATLEEWLWCLTGLYNWGIKKLENDAKDKIYWSEFALCAKINGHSKTIDIPMRIMRGILKQAHYFLGTLF